jgi:hypothetical protein
LLGSPQPKPPHVKVAPPSGPTSHVSPPRQHVTASGPTASRRNTTISISGGSPIGWESPSPTRCLALDNENKPVLWIRKIFFVLLLSVDSTIVSSSSDTEPNIWTWNFSISRAPSSVLSYVFWGTCTTEEKKVFQYKVI